MKVRLFLLLALAPIAASVVFPALAAEESPGYPHGAFSDRCELCHTGDAWKPATISKEFRHTKRFQLVGAHRTASCRACHVSLDFQKAPTACADCHRDPHIGELGADCARCHTPRNFLDRSAQLDAHRLTRFPLTGAHVTTDCQECHLPASQGQLQYVNTPIECQACHLPQYQATTNPNHVDGAFPTDCAQCHKPTTWSRASFDHNVTGFPLTGAHTRTPCMSCHTNGYDPPPPTNCYACHQTDYPQEHVTAGFPTTCQDCHSTTSWENATFAHSTAFPLTGAHTTTPCVGCHASGYAGTPTACVACHDTDYQNPANDPNHVTAALPSDCASCHNTNGWPGARYTQHDALYFRIYSGRHNGRWNACSTCHTSASNYAVFDCLSCHREPDTSQHHGGVPGYLYDSPACYTCHRNS